MKTGTNQPAAPSELPRTTPPPRHGLSPHPVPGHLCEGGCTSLPLLDQIRLNPTKSDQIRVKKIEKCRPSGHSRKGLAPSVANPCSSVAPPLCEGGSSSPEESTCAAVATNRKQSCHTFSSSMDGTTRPHQPRPLQRTSFNSHSAAKHSPAFNPRFFIPLIAFRAQTFIVRSIHAEK